MTRHELWGKRSRQKTENSCVMGVTPLFEDSISFLEYLLMKIMIMCGGRGSRLGSVTESIPKPLVLIGERTLLDHKLEYYKGKGYNQFIFCIGYRGDVLKKHIGLHHSNVEFSDAGEEAGILKRIYEARDFIDESCIISYGDTYAEIDINALARFHKDHDMPVTLVVAPIRNPFGIVQWNGESVITEFKEKPILNHYIGYMVIDKQILEEIPTELIELPDGKGLIAFFQFLIKKGSIKAFNFDGLRVTINTQTELDKARKELKKYLTI